MKNRILFPLVPVLLLSCPALSQPAVDAEKTQMEEMRAEKTGGQMETVGGPVFAPVAAPPIIEQPKGEWNEWPIMAGDWTYRVDDRGSVASFGVGGGDPVVIMRCDAGSIRGGLGRVFLLRAQTMPTPPAEPVGRATIRTSSMTKEYDGVLAGDMAYIAVEFSPYDPLLDAMAYSRGRFALEVMGQKNIAIPAWSEISHIIEDCRR